jgi:predicted dienelactone hydrolase
VIIDNGLEIARQVGATKIPEMFVFTDSAERPIYQGRVDNLFVGFGKKRVAPTSYDLQNVLQAVRDKAPVSFSRTEVVGCSIAFQDGQSADQTANSKTIGSAASYDPLQISTDEIETQLFTVEDVSRSREIPIRVYFPKKTEPAPVIVFSHGLGGSRDNAVYVCKHWAARGFVAVVAQHPGSDESVWKGQRPLEILSKMKAAANGENFTLRVKDIPAVIDQLEKWNQETQHPLHNRLNLERIGMTGHSFGAITTQAVSGQSFLGRQQFTDDRIKAALPMSPSAPRAGSSDQSFGKVAIPWLLMTGTKDTSIINDTTVENRLSVYPALPEGGKYELVLHEGAHSAFSERALPGDRGKRNPNHHRAILAISTAFWEAYLNQDSAARNWLDGDAVRGVLEADDRWQRK